MILFINGILLADFTPSAVRGTCDAVPVELELELLPAIFDIIHRINKINLNEFPNIHIMLFCVDTHTYRFMQNIDFASDKEYYRFILAHKYKTSFVQSISTKQRIIRHVD